MLQFKINNLKEDHYNNYWKTGGPVHLNYTESVQKGRGGDRTAQNVFLEIADIL